MQNHYKFVLSTVFYIVLYSLSFGSLAREIYISYVIKIKRITSQGRGYYIIRNLFTYYISALLVILLSEYIYYEIAEHFSNIGAGIIEILLISGVVLTSIFICAARLIEIIYKFFRNKTLGQDLEAEPLIKEAEKTYVICWTCLASIVISLVFNYRIGLYAICFFLGRMFWFDSKTSFKDVFEVMNSSNPEIRSSLKEMRIVILMGGILYAAIYALIRST